MPRLANAKVAALIATLSDSQRFLDSATYEARDLSSLMDICGTANAAVMSYVLFDLKSSIEPRAAPTAVAASVRVVVARNIYTYQDELERLQPFACRCMAKVIPLLNEFTSSLGPGELTDTRRAGLRQLRSGILEMYVGFLQTVNCAAARESYRARVLQAMAESVTPYAATLQPEDRRRIRDEARAVQAAAPKAFHADLKRIADAMSETSCTALCGF